MVHSSVNATAKHDADLFLPLAENFGLTFSAFGELLSTPEPEKVKGSLNLSSSRGLEPAPVTPTSLEIDGVSTPYQFLSGTIKATYNAHRDLHGSDNIFVGPGMPTGNTGESLAILSDPKLANSFPHRKTQSTTGHYQITFSDTNIKMEEARIIHCRVHILLMNVRSSLLSLS